MNCYKCKSKENLTKNSTYTNGKFQYVCRQCNTEKLKKYRATTIGKKNVFDAVARSIAKYPERQKARKIVYFAIKAGKLLKPEICSICKSEKELFGHHTDYSKPLEVEWVCRDCHFSLHSAITESDK